MTGQQNSVCLRFPANEAWSGMLRGAAVSATRVYGLDEAKSLRLSMALEEGLTFLSGALPGQTISLELSPQPGGMMAELRFERMEADLSALNLVPPDFTPDEALASGAMSLILVSRLTDRFSIVRLSPRDGDLALRLRFSRTFKPIDPIRSTLRPLRQEIRGRITVGPISDPELIREACELTMSAYPPELTPFGFNIPDLIAERVGGGELLMLGAHDESKSLLGLIMLELTQKRCITFDGPFVFAADKQRPALSLIHAMTAHAARTSALTLLSNLSTPELPRQEFESSGEVIFRSTDGQHFKLPIWFRQLREDEGDRIFAHPDQEPFIRGICEDAVLPRDIRVLPQEQSLGPMRAKSVLGLRLRRSISEASLFPMLEGADFADNLARHVQALSAEGFANIFFRLDLGESWQAALGGDLERAGFRPAALLPLAERSDVLLLKHERS